MAKKQQPDLTNILARTEQPQPEQAQEQPIDKMQAVGVALKSSEWQRLGAIAQELGIKRHVLAQYVLRDFITRYDRGEVKTETKKSLPGL